MINLDRFSDDELRVIQPQLNEWNKEKNRYLCVLILDSKLNERWKECVAERLNVSTDSLKQSLEFLVEKAIYKGFNMSSYLLEGSVEAITEVANKIRWSIIEEAQEVIDKRLKETEPKFKELFKEYAQLMLQDGHEQALKRLQEHQSAGYICLSFIDWARRTGRYDVSLIKDLHLALQKKFEGFNPNIGLNRYFTYKLTRGNPDINNKKLLDKLGEDAAAVARIEFLEEAARW